MENTTIAGFIALILFVGIAIRFRIKVMLLFVKIFQGKYSYKYYTLISKYFYEKTYPEATKYEVHYFINSMFENKAEHVFLTNEKILFAGLEFGKRYPKFYKEMGKPDYLTMESDNISKIKILISGFKRQIYNYESTLLYFYSEHLFILGQYLFKREKQHIDENQLVRNLQERYNIKDDLTGLKEFLILDNTGAKIHFIDNGFSANLTFYNPEAGSLAEVFNSYSYNGFGIKLPESQKVATTF